MDSPLFEKKPSSEKIIEFVNIIGKHNIAAKLFVELNNGFYLSGGYDNILILYDNQFREKMRIKELKDWAFKVIEKKDSRIIDENKTTLFCCLNKYLVSILLDTKNLKADIKEYMIEDRTFVNCIEMKENNFISTGFGCSSYYIDIYNKNSQFAEHIIIDKTYRGAIRLNDKNVALTSNSIMPNGENKLIFYNIKSKNISIIAENYSFTISNNNMSLISKEKINNSNKILICACKKYRKGQKNGILLVNPNPGDSRRINNEFYDTGNYEVYCFCQIFLVKNNNNNHNSINEKYKRNIEINDTDYFFVGGFDLDKRIGIIKMFRLIFDEKISNTKIEFVQDIIIDGEERFEDFDSPISNIYQSKLSGHIAVTCYNGNIYLFTPPNLNYYLEEHE